MFSWLYLALPCASLRVQPSASLDATLLLRLRQTTEVAEQVLSSEGRDITRWWGNMGHSGQVGPEIALLRRLVTNQSVKTVCEIGMNAGHSAVALLEGLDTHLVEFDLLSLPYSNASRAALERAYPGRTQFFQGKSQIQVPLYADLVRRHMQPPCDLWFVDGDHEHGAILDMRAALTVSSDGALLVADDCSTRHRKVMHAFRQLVEEGHLVDAWNSTVHLPHPTGTKGWCVGRFRRDEKLAHLLEPTWLATASVLNRFVDGVSMYWWRERNGFINRPFYWCAVIGGPRDGVRRVYNVSDCQTARMQQSTAAYGPNENITTEVLAKAKHAEEHRKLYCNSQSGKDRAWIDRCISSAAPAWTSLRRAQNFTKAPT
jgi:predicted O-methyltransferase YrrM